MKVRKAVIELVCPDCWMPDGKHLKDCPQVKPKKKEGKEK